MFQRREYNLTESDSAAELTCRQALAKAGYAFAYTPATFHWSQLVNPRGDKHAAMEAYTKLLDAEPENKAALEGLAYLYQISGYAEKATELREQLYALEARDMGIPEADIGSVAAYFSAKIGAHQQPVQVPTSYIKAHFNKYAENFDNHLTNHLEYKAPQIIREYLEGCGINLNAARVLDIGCGTGLMGLQLADQVELLDGVDISNEMLDQARTRNIYNNLFEDDYRDVMLHAANAYTLITAADVFVYQGELDSVFSAANKALCIGGCFVFTVERIEDGDFKLRNTGRYQHSSSYVNTMAKKYGFDKTNEQELILRKEDGNPVHSLLFSFKKR